jgi:CO/xanthine dehydrogenase Mo-binding subunit
MDELALEAGCDPVEFRLRHLRDARARAVIEAAAERAGWESGVKHGGCGQGRGQGLGFAQYKNQKCYAAVVVELRVEQTGAIRLERAVVAADAGQIVNPDGLANQLEGGVVQASSWALKEEVRFSPEGVESVDWESYPILRLGEAPQVETVLIDRPGLPSLGCGEATQGPTPAAIANAVFAACGARLRQMPFVPERVRAALAR